MHDLKNFFWFVFGLLILWRSPVIHSVPIESHYKWLQWLQVKADEMDWDRYLRWMVTWGNVLFLTRLCFLCATPNRWWPVRTEVSHPKVIPTFFLHGFSPNKWWCCGELNITVWFICLFFPLPVEENWSRIFPYFRWN